MLARNAKILVMGVGGGGCNAVNAMIASGVESADFIAVNTDEQALNLSSATKKITLGASVTKGLGAGARPDVGKQAAEESRNEIDKALDGVDMLFITAGMGGGTGTGAAPVIASIARDKGILTVGVVTKPFAFEGFVREKNADEGIKELKKFCDTLIVIPNNNLLKVLGAKASMVESFRYADSVLRDSVKGLADLIGIPSLINVDFADVRTIMKDKGIAHLTVGSAEGPNKIQEAVRKAVMSPLLDTNISGATGVLLYIVGGTSIGVMETNQAATMVRECVSEDANIIFGMGIEEDYGDKVQVLIVATGFEEGRTSRLGIRPVAHGPMTNDQFKEKYGYNQKQQVPQQGQLAADENQYQQPSYGQNYGQQYVPQQGQQFVPQTQPVRPSYASIYNNQPAQQPVAPEQPQNSGRKIPAWMARIGSRNI